MNSRVAIVGAGIAGLACADRLRDSGIATVLFDKARGPGGRMSTRRVETAAGTAHIDHGAQFFTVRNPAFRAQVSSWEALGLVARWSEAAPDAWIGTPTMNAPVRHMTAHHDVRFGHHVHGIVKEPGGWRVRFDDRLEGPFGAVVIALPAEQAAAILGLHDFSMASDALSARSQPCWTAMVVLGGRLDIPVSHFSDSGIIAWAARNSAKPGRNEPEAWVVQGSGTWSAAHAEQDAAEVARTLFEALGEHCSGGALPPVLSLTAHFWRFAMAQGIGRGALWNDLIGLGACGDWLLGPRVELAWLSGLDLGNRMISRPGAIGTLIPAA